MLRREFMMLAPDGADGGSLSVDTGVTGDVGSTDIAGSGSEVSGVATAPSEFTVKIDGAEQKVTADKLIERYQKEHSAEKRFQEAADKEKNAEKYINAIKNLDNLIASKNVDGLKKVLGDDIFKELVRSHSPEPQATSNEYSEEDIYIANKYGMDVDELVATRKEALGTDKPIVNELKGNLTVQEQQIAELQKQIADMQTQSKTSTLETKFNTIKDRYPDFSKGDIRDVIDIIEHEKLGADEFDKAFEIQKEAIAKREAAWEKRYLEKKKEQANGLLTSSQGGSISIKEDEFKNLNGADKLNKLKQMYRQ